jgi:curli biogenesis system outer membrane secretion channel CsgG
MSKEAARPHSPDTPRVKRVGVLLFNNISGRPEAGEIVTNLFVTELFKSGRFYVEEPGNIVQFLGRERIDTLGEIEIDGLRTLCGRLGLDAVIVGTVQEFDYGDAGSSPEPVVAMTVRMIEPRGGNIIWSAQTKRKGDDYVIAFGLRKVRPVTELARKAVEEMIRTIP